MGWGRLLDPKVRRASVALYCHLLFLPFIHMCYLDNYPPYDFWEVHEFILGDKYEGCHEKVIILLLHF